MTDRDAHARLRYLHEVITLLYPPSAAKSARTLLPHRFVPRRLVPRARWHAVLGRGSRVLVSDGPNTVETYLTGVLGRHVRAVVHVRPARRANRKPILEAYGPAGLIGYVKIGDSEKARDLVRHEADVLGMLAERPLRVVCAPTVLHRGSWNGLYVLVLSPLAPTSRPIPAALLNAAIAEIAELGDSARHAGPAHGDAARHRTTDHWGTKPWGAEPRWAWHGDFSPWNIAAAADGRLLVWDWERFAIGVPLGFDAVHHFLHRALKRMRPVVAAQACLAQAVPILEPFGLCAEEARRTVAGYLITLADRHHRDGHEPLGPASEWLNPIVDHLEPLL